MTLSPEQRALVVRLGRADPEGPPARDYTSAGCGALVFAALGAVVLPTVTRFLGQTVGLVLMVLLIGLAIFGVGGWLLGRSIGMAPVYRRVEASAAALVAEAPRLAEGAEPSEGALRAAVTLLRDGTHSPGPYTAATYDAAAMAERLGAALPLIVAVEEVLAAEDRIYRVFTEAPGAAPGGASGDAAGGPAAS